MSEGKAEQMAIDVAKEVGGDFWETHRLNTGLLKFIARWRKEMELWPNNYAASNLDSVPNPAHAPTPAPNRESGKSGWDEYWESLDRDSQDKLSEGGIEAARAWFTIGSVWGKPEATSPPPEEGPMPLILKEWAVKDLAHKYAQTVYGDTGDSLRFRQANFEAMLQDFVEEVFESEVALPSPPSSKEKP